MNYYNFQDFAKKGNGKAKQLSCNAVIYTRVSTKEQAETNLSLETQRRHCLDYAKKSNLNVIASFGGTYESAKTDERKEFQSMLNFVKKQKEKISYIIVFSIDRFSRSGSNAIFISEQLKKQGIHILSVTQQIETQTPSGKFQQNMYFMFSQLDNDMRREKTVAGMREMLRQGYWATKAPIGYSHVPGANRDGRIVIDEKGKLIRKAFHWKAEEGLSNTQIAERLELLGLKIYKQQLTDIFKNPFYCGILTSTLLDGEVVKGKHPKLVSEEVFLKVNAIQSKNAHGYLHQKERQQFPLKHFVRCEACGTPMTAYRIEKKNAEYYKCNKSGCRCNRRTSILHEGFSKLLSNYTIKEESIAPLKQIMSSVFYSLNEANTSNKEDFQKSLDACNKKIETIEERFALAEIDRNIYEKFSSKYKQEKAEIEKKLTESSFELSNLESYMDFTFKMCLNLPEMWQKADFHSKQKLQTLVFPEGVLYNKEKDDYRTDRVNTFFAAIPLLTEACTKKRSGLATDFVDKSALVAGSRIELPALGL